MKRFLKTLLIFIIPLGIVTLAFEVYLRTMNTEYKQKINGLTANYGDIEILALGNSHAYNGVDPRQFELETYNMAAGNQSLYFDKRITLKHIDSLKKLKYVLISVDQHSLYFSSQGIRDTWLYYDYDIKYKDKTEFWNDISHFWLGYTPRIAVSIVKDKLLEQFKEKQTHSAEVIKGFMPHYGSATNAFTDKNIKRKANFFNREVKDSNEREENLADLEDFIVQLKKRDITPILFTLPMHNDIYGYLLKEYVDQNNEDVQYLKQKYNIQHFNFSNQGDDQSLFYNSDHLNGKGAEVFSKKINTELKKLL
ncbi:D-alanyl-lipoteichoic acid biosynthesis protein DltD [Aquimarina sp. 2304DJ70-9]|uniref:D-alanyl-lipoteichoic acid biosynthesis protein DltD n=1 Tax=Aquimarina penaris TaxID=3231044 RepID=UPI0034622A49